MNRPPIRRRNRLRRRAGFAWTAPYASWTLANTRRQAERDACNDCSLIAMMLAQYLLIAAVVVRVTVSMSGGTRSDLLQFLVSRIWVASVGAGLLFAFWFCWPYLNRLLSRSGPLNADSNHWTTHRLIVNSLPIASAIILILISPLFALMFLTAYLAVLLLLSGLRRRVGIDERCTRCAYPVTTPRWSLGLCPECGRNLDARHAIILGHNTRSPARLAAGALLTAAVFALAFVI